jgi:hypothetical protein
VPKAPSQLFSACTPGGNIMRCKEQEGVKKMDGEEIFIVNKKQGKEVCELVKEIPESSACKEEW